jgi:hypothetical protein
MGAAFVSAMVWHFDAFLLDSESEVWRLSTRGGGGYPMIEKLTTDQMTGEYEAVVRALQAQHHAHSV